MKYLFLYLLLIIYILTGCIGERKSEQDIYSEANNYTLLKINDLDISLNAYLEYVSFNGLDFLRFFSNDSFKLKSFISMCILASYAHNNRIQLTKKIADDIAYEYLKSSYLYTVNIPYDQVKDCYNKNKINPFINHITFPSSSVYSEEVDRIIKNRINLDEIWIEVRWNGDLTSGKELITPGMLPMILENKVYSMKPGEISVLQINDKYHAIELIKNIPNSILGINLKYLNIKKQLMLKKLKGQLTEYHRNNKYMEKENDFKSYIKNKLLTGGLTPDILAVIDYDTIFVSDFYNNIQELPDIILHLLNSPIHRFKAFMAYILSPIYYNCSYKEYMALIENIVNDHKNINIYNCNNNDFKNMCDLKNPDFTDYNHLKFLNYRIKEINDVNLRINFLAISKLDFILHAFSQINMDDFITSFNKLSATEKASMMKPDKMAEFLNNYSKPKKQYKYNKKNLDYILREIYSEQLEKQLAFYNSIKIQSNSEHEYKKINRVINYYLDTKKFYEKASISERFINKAVDDIWQEYLINLFLNDKLHQKQSPPINNIFEMIYSAKKVFYQEVFIKIPYIYDDRINMIVELAKREMTNTNLLNLLKKINNEYKININLKTFETIGINPLYIKSHLINEFNNIEFSEKYN